MVGRPEAVRGAVTDLVADHLAAERPQLRLGEDQVDAVVERVRVRVA